MSSTVQETALTIPISMKKASQKLAIAGEQVKLLENCQKIKMGTRGVEIILAKIIADDILAVGDNIASDVSDVEVYMR